MTDRKYFLDNLRWLNVLLLFPCHSSFFILVFRQYFEGDFGGRLSALYEVTDPWIMPVMFVIAGISTVYALQKRSINAFIKERAMKLFVPLIAGILTLVPVLTYVIRRILYRYDGTFFNHYAIFFTEFSGDTQGFREGFALAHLWFLLVLFVFSLAVIPIIRLTKNNKIGFEKLPMPVILLLFLLPALGSFIPDVFVGIHLGAYFIWFLLGYFILSKDKIQAKLERWRFLLLGCALAGVMLILMERNGIVNTPQPQMVWDVYKILYGWVMLLALLGMAKRYFNINNKVTVYLSKSSFGVYLFHVSWNFPVAFFAYRLTDNPALRMAVILPVTAILTFLTYELCRRIPVTRWMFGLKK